MGATAGGIGGVNNNIVGTGGGRGGSRGRSGKTKPPRYSTQMASNSQMSHTSAMISQSSQVSCRQMSHASYRCVSQHATSACMSVVQRCNFLTYLNVY